jgi:cytochrome c biogenesis protein CcdA
MKKQNQNTRKEELTIFEKIVEAVGWIQIVLSPLLIALLIAVPFYLSNKTYFRLIICFIIVFIGLVIGIVWANKVAKKKGTMNFLSRIYGTPELDKEEENKI